MKEQIDTPTLIPTQTNSGVGELEQIEEMAKILTEAAHMACEDIPFAPPNDYDPCHLKAECHRCKEARALIDAGYRKQSVGVWEIVIGSNGKEKMVCTNCRHQQDLSITFTYCPNCGAKMKGAAYERAD